MHEKISLDVVIIHETVTTRHNLPSGYYIHERLREQLRNIHEQLRDIHEQFKPA